MAVEAEKVLLGSILLNPELYDQAAEILTHEHFALDAHRRIFDRMTDLVEADKPIDYVMLQQELERNKEFAAVGGMSYLSSLMDGIPERPSIRNYAEIVRDKALLRGVIIIAQNTISDAIESGVGATEVMSRMEADVMQLSDDVEDKGFSTLADSVNTAGSMDNYLSDMLDPRATSGIPTGYTEVDRVIGGLRESELIVIAARPSMGKAQPLDAKILTPSGFVHMGDLTVGSKVAAYDGTESEVVAVHERGQQPTFRVAFSDGRKTECSEDHLWRVNYREWSSPRVLSTAKISEMLCCARYRKRLWIDLPVGEYASESNLPIDPWALGALLGNGCFVDGTPEFSSADTETIERLRECVSILNLRLVSDGEFGYRITAGHNGREENVLTLKLRDMHLWGRKSVEKFIPEIYKLASRTSRMKLIQGLLDTDGEVDKTGSIIFSTSSKRLRDDFIQLVRSVGGICTTTSRTPIYTSHEKRKEGKTAYRCYVRHENPRDLLCLSRKRSRIKPERRMSRVTFSNILYIGTKESRCITVSHPSGLYVTDDFIVTHNSAFAGNLVENVLMGDPERVVAWFALEMSKQAVESRLLASSARVDLRKMRGGTQGSMTQRLDLGRALERLLEQRCYIDDSSYQTPVKMRSKCRQLKRKFGRLDLVVADYLQLMSGGGKFESREKEVSFISRGLKALAKQLHVPVVALSQLNRVVEGRSDKRPLLSDLRESGSLEQDADIVAFLHRPEVYEKDNHDLEGIAEFIIGKQREGPTETVKLCWLKQYTRFDNLSLES